MKKPFSVILLIATLTLMLAGTCFAGWIIFHKPPYKGKLIDAETKEPIEGAVVVVIYQKYPFISGPGGGSTSIIKVKEALTDKNGVFSIPACFSLMGPNSFEESTSFMFYKPGYAYPVGITRFMGEPALEEYLLEKNYGKQKDISLEVRPWQNSPYGDSAVTTCGIVELKPAKTWDERDKACRDGLLDNIPENEWPIFKEMLNQEEKWLDQHEQNGR